jgi:hypothetical protein
MGRTRAVPKVKAKPKLRASQAQKKSNVTTGPKRPSRATRWRPVNHRFSLNQRTVIAYLFAPNGVRPPRTGDETLAALNLFKHIFHEKTGVGLQMLLEDWADSYNKTGEDMYNTRICKEAGEFTQVEIAAHRFALNHLERASIYTDIDIELDHIDMDFGKPADGEFDRPSTPLSGIERDVADAGFEFALGYVEEPVDRLCPTRQFYADQARHQNLVNLVSAGESTRSTLWRVGRTPSLPPVLQNGVFVRVDRNAQPAPAPMPQANQLPAIDEEVEEDAAGDEVAQGDGNGDDEDEDEQRDASERDDDNDHDGSEYGAPGDADGFRETHERDDQGDENFDMDDGHAQDDQAGVQGGFSNASGDEYHNNRLPSNDEQDAVSSIASPVSRLSVTPSIMETRYTPARREIQPIKREPRIQAALNAVAALQPIERIGFFKICFPKLSERQANQLTINTHTEVEQEWRRLRTIHRHMFTLQDALISSDSTFSMSYTRRLRMFHRSNFRDEWNGICFNRPLIFSTISVSDELYRRGGPLVRVHVTGTNLQEDVMICHNAFCTICIAPSRLPPSEDLALDLHSVPFVHANTIGYDRVFLREGGDGLGSVYLMDDGLCGLGVIPLAFVLDPEHHRIDTIDGVERSVKVCNPLLCEQCRLGDPAF